MVPKDCDMNYVVDHCRQQNGQKAFSTAADAGSPA